MPRKKVPPPKPIEVYHYDTIVVEVYRDDELPTGRGLHARYKKADTLQLALELLLEARDDAKRGLRKQFFADIRNSAVVLARAPDRVTNASARTPL